MNTYRDALDARYTITAFLYLFHFPLKAGFLPMGCDIEATRFQRHSVLFPRLASFQRDPGDGEIPREDTRVSE